MSVPSLTRPPAGIEFETIRVITHVECDTVYLKLKSGAIYDIGLADPMGRANLANHKANLIGQVRQTDPGKLATAFFYDVVGPDGRWNIFTSDSPFECQVGGPHTAKGKSKSDDE